MLLISCLVKDLSLRGQGAALRLISATLNDQRGNRATCTEFRHFDKLSASLRGNRAKSRFNYRAVVVSRDS
ncbi:hypothetical protein, partial [Nostoc sp. DedQUE02]|uniref:hypothetical protein n=1 Tax=Nostoc sp. DedQUE02 TaxID=3075388 RepID=UPI00391B6097